MKIKVSYRISYNAFDHSDWIEAKITIIDRGAFSTIFIFNNVSDYPTNIGWELQNKNKSDCIIRKSLMYKDAEAWVSRQITALKEKLDQWRGQRMPDSYEIEI